MRLLAVLSAAVIGLALIAGTGMGQGDAKKDKAKGQLPPGWKDLNLSAEQKEKVYRVQMEYKAKMADLQSALKKLQAQQRQDEVAVLTEAQKDQLRKALDGAKKTDEKK